MWHSVDPADEHHNPYIYVADNPIYYIDKDGAVKNPFAYMKGQIQQTFEHYLGTHEGQVELGIKSTEVIADMSGKYTSTMLVAALPSQGTTLPAAGVGSIINTLANIGNLGFKIADASFFNGSWSDVGIQTFNVGINVLLNQMGKGITNWAHNIVKYDNRVPSNFLTGPNYSKFFGVNRYSFLSNNFGKTVQDVGTGIGIGV